MMPICKECIHNEMCYATHTDESPACCDYIAAQTWIPVTERLPDSERWVFAWYKNLNMPGGRAEKAIYMCDDYDPYWRPLERDITEVTHWMELPSTEGLNET